MSKGNRRRPRSRLVLGAGAGVVAVGLVAGAVAEAASWGDSASNGLTASALSVAAPLKPASHALQADFRSAAAEFHVPESVLLAVSYQQTLWESHRGAPSVTGNYNVMGLTSVSASDLTATRPSGQPATDEQSDGAGDDPRAAARRHHASATSSRLADGSSAPVVTPAMRTLDTAAGLIGSSSHALRSSMRDSVRGGAALLAKYQRAGGGSLSATSPADWYAAVERFSQASDAGTARQFADRVFATLRSGAHRVTGDNQDVVLKADPAVSVRSSAPAHSLSPDLQPQIAQQPTARQAATSSTVTAECPSTLACTFTPAAYQQTSSTDPTSYGNYDLAQRPNSGYPSINTIVIHDTESTKASAISSFQDPTSYASAHYIVGADGSVTQLVETKNIAWHAGNKYINAHSLGIEHEGYALQAGSWYSEQEYQSSAALVKYLANRFGIPLDREHIIGHDGVPAPLQAYYSGMHWDPGPWWNWNHYLSLMGASPNGTDQPVVGGLVTIAPPWSTNYEPTLTGCGSSTTTCPANPANFVYLRTSPSSTASLITDPAIGSTNSGTTLGWDWSDKAVYGQTFVVAAVQGDWTAIWFDGQKAWFYNPGGAYTMANTKAETSVVTPAGSTAVPVYGRAYPEASAYPSSLSSYASATNQQITPLNMSIQPGQSYSALSAIAGDNYYAENYNCTANPDCLLIVGTTQYIPIRYNHRLAYVKASDVTTGQPTVPPTGTFKPVTPTRIMDTRNGTGVPQAQVGAGGMVSLQVAGTAGVPTSGVTAVVMNVTATNPTAASNVTVYPDGQTRPAVSNLNFTAGETIPNLVKVPVVNGKVDFYNHSGSVDLIADITGYYTSDGSGSPFSPVTPTRIMDTRNGTGVPQAKVGAGGMVSLSVAGTAGVPASGATAVVMNVTATNPTSASNVTVYPDGTTRPGVSNLNFTAGETIPNLVVVPVVDGKVDFYNHSGTVDLIADITGYYGASTGSVYHPAGPVRVMDTRNGTGVAQGQVGAGGMVSLPLGGGFGVPTNATAVVLNVTATNPTAASNVTVYPDGQTRPAVSNLNFTAGETIPNLVVVPVVNGRVDFYNHSGSVDLIADLAGFYTQQ